MDQARGVPECERSATAGRERPTKPFSAIRLSTTTASASARGDNAGTGTGSGVQTTGLVSIEQVSKA